MSRALASAVYVGSIRHRRFAPRKHAFRYPLFLMYLDLAELDEVFRGRWLWSSRRPNLAWFDRSDHLGDPSHDLDAAVREQVSRELGFRPAGPIRLLTHLRMFGHCFNPISLYYCFDAAGEKVDALVAEVHNTPWGERHCYVLDARRTEEDEPTSLLTFSSRKEFHVSPFLPMSLEYSWRTTVPAQGHLVHIEGLECGTKIFDATLHLERRPADALQLAGVLLRFPWMTVRVLLWIYWEALRLRLKGIPFHAHPERGPSARST